MVRTSRAFFAVSIVAFVRPLHGVRSALACLKSLLTGGYVSRWLDEERKKKNRFSRCSQTIVRFDCVPLSGK